LKPEPEQSIESMWIDEMIERKMTVDQLIAQLKEELKNPDDDQEFLQGSIELLERMKHA
jgi:hypothetical protein